MKFQAFDVKRYTEEVVGMKLVKEQMFLDEEHGSKGKYVAYFLRSVPGWLSSSNELTRITIHFSRPAFTLRYELAVAMQNKDTGWVTFVENKGMQVDEDDLKEKAGSKDAFASFSHINQPEKYGGFMYNLFHEIMLEALDDVNVFFVGKTLEQSHAEEEEEESEDEE